MNAQSIGLGLQVIRDGGPEYDLYLVEEGSWAVTTQTVKAVNYR